MKKIFLLALLFLFSNSFNLFAQQYYYTFSELKGMEDSNSDSHLFYRMYTFKEADYPFSNYIENSIHHFDIQNNVDTLFLWDGQDYNYNTTSILDLKFLDTDPSKYINCGFHAVLDQTAFIQRYDESMSSFYGLGIVENLEIQNDSIMFATTTTDSGIIKSTDGGGNWFPFNSAYKKVISINPNNDDIFFADNDNLYKSTNGGLNFSKVDTSNYNYSQFFYDKDSVHIYNLLNNGLKVSDADGNAFSWTERYSSSNPIYVSIDYSQSGSIYLADGRYIYHSTDYGQTFNEYKTLNRRITGIYKKPNSDKIYAATKYDLYEITPDTTVTLKHLLLDPDIFSWFPLKVGNEWVYDSKFTSEGEIDEHTLVTKITRQFHYNNSTYFDINGKNGLSYKVDSTSGKIYKAYFNNDTLSYEEFYIDLTVEVGDTFYTDQYTPILFESEQPFSQLDINSLKRNYNGLSSPSYNFSIVKDLGLNYEFWWELVGYENILKGAIINGIVYGDTTVVGVNDPDNTIKEFSLYQNYPNPFNPITKIKFVIPKSSFVSLKVYDVLGREVATLVNEEKQPGSYEVEFSAKGGSASGGNAHNLSSGIYFYKLQAGSYSSTKKMIYLK
jgi:Secretion system C-terminal sorting domain